MNLLSLGAFWSNIWMDLWISLNSLVFQLIEWLYEVFEVIANVNLFSRQAFDDITSRLYVVIGVAMLFIFAYNIILMIINPEDKKSMGNTGKVVKETIIALVLVILLPAIFNYMAIFQKNLLDSHILEQIILGSTAGANVDCDFSELSLIDNYVTVKSGSAIANMETECNEYKALNASKQGAFLVAPTIFTAFFHPKNYGYNECVKYLEECSSQGTSCNSSDALIATDDDKELCANYVYDTNMGQFTGGILEFTTDGGDIYSDAWSKKGIFDFNYLMAFIAGCLAVYMFVCYAMAIGVRVAKLGFLQIISPIPVMLRIIPKQKEAVYDKWFKQLLNTYLDVFIRLAIIYFCMFGISLVPDVLDSLFASLTGDWFGTKALACVVVILGILQFAQEAPKLLQEFFGGMGGGNFALKSPRKQFNENKLAKGVVGWGTGATLGMASGIAQGNPLKAAGGIFRGGKNGAKNMAAADLTKKGAFTDTLKNSKYQTDYEQNHTRYKALKSGIAQSGGVGAYFKDELSGFKDFLKDTENQSERYAAANKLFTDSASFNDVIINGIIKDENTTKGLWAENKDLALGDEWYKRDNDKGVWYGKDENGVEREFTKSEMKKRMDTHFAETKAKEMAKRLNNSDDKAIRDSFKRWSEDFNKTLRENLPKLGTEVGESFFKTVSENGGIEVASLDELIKKTDELHKKGLDGDKKAFEDLAKMKVAMDKGFKDIKDGQYKDMHEKKDK